MMATANLTLREKLGLDDIPARFEDVKLAFLGDAYVPKSKFSLSTLRQLVPRTALQLWLGNNPYGRRTWVGNLFNHTPTPVEAGWSVEITQVEDFMGGSHTYNSHNGTDFSVPPGTRVAAAAAGRVVKVVNEYNRGGLKLVIDHGGGLITSSNHLGRAIAQVGDVVQQGEVVALSGYSGIDGLISFPFGVPHVHYNVWLNGVAVDPFGRRDETPLWLAGNEPVPIAGPLQSEVAPANNWAPEAIARGIVACKDPFIRAALAAEMDLDRQGCNLVFQYVTYPTRFIERPCPYAKPFRRTPRLALPFTPQEIDGIVLEHQPRIRRALAAAA